MTELAAKGSDATKRLFFKHGAKEPLFGVKVADLKVIHKKIKGDQALALKLYATGNGDAQYLAGLVADGAKLTTAQLDGWARTAGWCMISGTTVPWMASEHPEGISLALKWIESPHEHIVVSGWRSLGALVTVIPDEKLPVNKLSALLDRVVQTLAAAPDEVRSAMNLFVISCGTYVAPLGDRAIATARKLGKVIVDVGDTACKIPDAESYIGKSRRGAAIAPKRKTVRC
jgi:3-methyladenine DNA glycosylase AlkD